MDTPPKTTFSAHLSWAAMRRYLQGALSPEESQRVERHLQHCPRCSSAIVEYIQTEEPEHHKQYMKKLKGNLKSSQSTKKSFLSSFQIKAIRTTIAVAALLVFSFFAVKTVINKQDTHRPLPSESLATTKKSAETAIIRRKAGSKTSEKSTGAAVVPAKEELKKRVEIKKVENSSLPTKKEVVTKEKKQPQTRPLQPAAQPAPTPKVEEKVPEKQAVAEAPVAHPTPTEKESSSPVNEETASEEPASEVTKTVPMLEKLDVREGAQPVAPLGSNSPAIIPVPGNPIRER